MIFESGHITVTADHGTGTLAFGFGGEPVNALHLEHIREIERALRAIEACPSIRILVIRSAIPTGFCAGLSPIAHSSLVHAVDRSAFAWYGQEVLDRLAKLRAVSVAVIEGACLGAGFELALSCDYRLCVASSQTPLGFPDRFACFGGSIRLKAIAGRPGLELVKSGRIISAREAQRLGVIDIACSRRRSKIELRTFLDRIDARPVKSARPVDCRALAAERRAFSATQPPALLGPMKRQTNNPSHGFPTCIGILGGGAAVEKLVAMAALRGTALVVCGNRNRIFHLINESAKQGFATPLELEQIRSNVRTSDTLDGFSSAELVFVSEDQNPFRLAAAVRPRAVLCVVRPMGSDPPQTQSQMSVPFPFPRRLINISFCDANRVALFPDATTDPETLAALTEWFRAFGHTSVIFPFASRLLPRAA